MFELSLWWVRGKEIWRHKVTCPQNYFHSFGQLLGKQPSISLINKLDSFTSVLICLRCTYFRRNSSFCCVIRILVIDSWPGYLLIWRISNNFAVIICKLQYLARIRKIWHLLTTDWFEVEMNINKVRVLWNHTRTGLSIASGMRDVYEN
jgi:hypothetical protein